MDTLLECVCASALSAVEEAGSEAGLCCESLLLSVSCRAGSLFQLSISATISRARGAGDEQFGFPAVEAVSLGAAHQLLTSTGFRPGCLVRLFRER